MNMAAGACMATASSLQSCGLCVCLCRQAAQASYDYTRGAQGLSSHDGVSSLPLPAFAMSEKEAKLNKAATPKTARAQSSFALYFFVVVLSFGAFSILLNSWTIQPKVGDHHPSLSASGQQSALGKTLRASVHHPKGSGAASNNNDKDSEEGKDAHPLGGLDCRPHGGPDDAQAFAYWQDIPADSYHMSPFHQRRKQQTTGDDAHGNSPARTTYLTFEPDHGGWNNIRMSMETILALAFATGRTLVLPPAQELYLLQKHKHTRHGAAQQTEFSLSHFFHMEAIHREHEGLDIISMEEFLQRQGVTGQFKDPVTHQAVYPPGNETNFDGRPDEIFFWLRKHSHSVVWEPNNCLAVFPADSSDEAIQDMRAVFDQMVQQNPRYEDYVGKPVPVNASTLDRLSENRAERSEMCLYDQVLQAEPYLHFPMGGKNGGRLLVNPYQFLFFQDWREDLWMKRFIRDHVRYTDAISCAAARVVQGVRKRAAAYSGNSDAFDSIHVRRGDFQYVKTRISAADIYGMTKTVLPENTTLYIATDEKDKTFFDDLKKSYNVLFLNDFPEELGLINSNFYGMIEQLVAARGRYFLCVSVLSEGSWVLCSAFENTHRISLSFAAEHGFPLTQDTLPVSVGTSMTEKRSPAMRRASLIPGTTCCRIGLTTCASTGPLKRAFMRASSPLLGG